MTDVRQPLEQRRLEVSPDDGAFERLLQRRSAKRRRGRVTAVTVATVVVVVGAGAVWTAFGRGSPVVQTSPATSPSSSHVSSLVPWNEVPYPPPSFGFPAGPWRSQIADAPGLEVDSDASGLARGAMLSRLEALHLWFRSTLLADGWTVVWSHPVRTLAEARTCCRWHAALSARRGSEQLRVYEEMGTIGIVQLTVLRAPVTFVASPSAPPAGAPGPIDGETALERALESNHGVLASSTVVTYRHGARPVWIVSFDGGFRRCDVAGPGDVRCADRFAVVVDAGTGGLVPSASPSG